MTKRDLRTVGIASGCGIAAFLALYFFRRRVDIKTLAPTQVKWEGV